MTSNAIMQNSLEPNSPHAVSNGSRCSRKHKIIMICLILVLTTGTFIAGLLTGKVNKPVTPQKPVTPPVTSVPAEPGAKIIFEKADGSDLTDTEKSVVVAHFEQKADSLGLTDLKTVINDNKQIVSKTPNTDITLGTVYEFNTKPQLTFTDEGGNILLTSVDLKSAKAEYGQLTEMGSGIHYIEITLTPEGRKKFAKATGDNIGKPITISLDGNALSAPMVNEVIDSNYCVISGDFTADSAKSLVSQINAGINLPELKLKEFHISYK